MNELEFYLPHYYDKNKKKFVPYLYTNIAQNVLINTENDETIADVLPPLQEQTVANSSQINHFADSLKKISTEMEAYANKNLVINAHFSVWQRGASFSSPVNAYTADRMKCNGTGTVTKHANGMQITGSINLRYIMEDVDFNAISGKTVTLSYNKNGVIIKQSFTASSATVVNLDLSDCILNWIKLEIGDKATPFVPRLFSEELALCQRYYEKSYLLNDPPKTPVISGGRSGMAASFANSGGTTALPGSQFIVRKRINPTVEIFGRNGNPGTIWISGAGGDVGSTFIASVISDTGFLYIYQTATPVVLAANQMYHYHFTADAEI